MMMKHLLSGALLFAMAAPVATVSASTMSASSGHAYYPADDQCFFRDWGKLSQPYTGPCGARRYWDIPVENPNFTGNKTFSAFGASANMFASSTFATTCSAIVLGHSGAEPSISKWTLYQVLSTATPPGRWTTLGTLPIATDETVMYECQVTGESAGGGPLGFVGEVKGF